jgi:amino acid permease
MSIILRYFGFFLYAFDINGILITCYTETKKKEDFKRIVQNYIFAIPTMFYALGYLCFNAFGLQTK